MMIRATLRRVEIMPNVAMDNAVASRNSKETHILDVDLSVF